MTNHTTREISDPGYSVILDQMDVPRQRLSAYSKPVDLFQSFPDADKRVVDGSGKSLNMGNVKLLDDACRLKCRDLFQTFLESTDALSHFLGGQLGHFRNCFEGGRAGHANKSI
jgi:hypothetical protein